MAGPKDPREELPRQLAVSISALVVIALVVAGVFGAVALAATHYLGIGEQRQVVSAEPTMLFPTPPQQAEQGGGSQGAPGADGGNGKAGAGQGDDPKKAQKGTKKDAQKNAKKNGQKNGKKKDKAKQGERAGKIALHARPKQAGRFQRVRLFGRYPGGNGATLQVQRHQGRWVFFPTSATVRGGTFETWIQSGRPGVNRFRVVDKATGKRSEPVKVRIRPGRRR